MPCGLSDEKCSHCIQSWISFTLIRAEICKDYQTKKPINLFKTLYLYFLQIFIKNHQTCLIITIFVSHIKQIKTLFLSNCFIIQSQWITYLSAWKTETKTHRDLSLIYWVSKSNESAVSISNHPSVVWFTNEFWQCVMNLYTRVLFV